MLLCPQRLIRLRFEMSQSAKLSRVLDAMDITYSSLHNAGNDAYYTAKVLLRLLGDEDFRGRLNKPASQSASATAVDKTVARV